MEAIGERILKVRKQKGMSQEQLADLSKINLRTLQRIEKGDNEPRGNTLKQICEVLQINIEELVDYGKIDDRKYLVFLHLSVMTGIIIPLGNIILPAILWLNKRDKIINVDVHGKSILNFQILFTILVNVFLVIGVYGKISHDYQIPSFFYIYYLLIIVALLYPIFIASRINKGNNKKFYPNLIRFVK
ncbi:helix-turn-helix domain-containing protein [Flavobacterium pallidum]|uniref:XRE family transcriptional regulator n=1 Tax=Flavobacterium pallidum TaxID=2172098 RepID=A0A2S1SFE9_9FLAO|nr:helix-turn-helix domain-containing protein [Flavobacterium pallidum]AWI25091.1 XRE family transcriptional regulator [Flavobacterium pallidum]